MMQSNRDFGLMMANLKLTSTGANRWRLHPFETTMSKMAMLSQPSLLIASISENVSLHNLSHCRHDYIWRLTQVMVRVHNYLASVRRQQCEAGLSLMCPNFVEFSRVLFQSRNPWRETRAW